MDGLLLAFESLFSIRPFCLMMLGTALGITVGAIPGLTGAMLIAVTLPLTFAMGGSDAMVLLVSMYVGSISGGLITATLLRIPGTPASIMTTLDGYPMAQQGRPGRALGLGICASFVGGLISWIFLVLLSQPIAFFSVEMLGGYEYFSLILMAMVLMASVSGRSFTKGMFSGFLGILLAMPGVSPSTGEVRLTFGFIELSAGFSLLPVLIGMFAVNQIIRDIINIDQEGTAVRMSRRGMLMSLADWKRQAVNLIRSSLIGTWIGILPGIGANIGSAMAYSAAKNFSAHPEKFGHGAEEGVVSSEAANNATIGGALIPLIALGIPGSVIDAILLGALVIHGLQPGPLLFEHNPEIVYIIMATFFVANCFMFLFMVAGVGQLARLAEVPRTFLIPIILVFCVVGSYALSNRMFDVWVMLAFGLVGFAMEKGRIPLAPFVIGFVLESQAEYNLAKGLMTHGGRLPSLADGEWLPYVFFFIAVVLLVWPLWKRWRSRNAAAGAGTAV
jgi:putative tricarboxylic transport membrane protein